MELRLGDEGARVSLAEEEGEIAAVEGVEGDEIGFVEGFDAGRVA